MKKTIFKAEFLKTGLSISLIAMALSLGACADPDSATTQDDVDAAADPQTSVEQEAMGIDDANQATENVDGATTLDDPLVADENIVMDDGEVDVANIDESEILDGSESEEHVSTY